MKHVLILSLIFAAGIANATQPSNNTGNNGNGHAYGHNPKPKATTPTPTTQAAPTATANGGLGGLGGAGGAGGLGGQGGTGVGTGIGTGIGVSNSASTSAVRSNNTNTANGGAGGVGNGGVATATNGGNTTGNQNVTIEGAQAGSGSGNGVYSTVYERSAPGVAVGAAIQPLTSCRLSVSLGGSSAGGAGAGGIPIGNDETCLAAARLALMERVGGFTAEDKQRAVCNVEGMDSTSVCKALKEPAKTATAPVQAAPVASNSSDPFIAMSGRTYPSGPYANK